MKLFDVKERWLMCWLMFMGRGVTQAVRVVLGALMPFIAALSQCELGSSRARMVAIELARADCERSRKNEAP